MTEKGKTKFNPMAMAVNSIAIALTLSAFMGDSSAFLGWLYLGVLDGHWNDITLQILLVCLVVSFAIFLLVAAFFGLGIRLSQEGTTGNVKFLSELGSHIDTGWEKALRMSMTCLLIALSLLVGFLFSSWKDILWWSDFFRGTRAADELRLNDAHALYQAAFDIAGDDRKPLALLSLGKVAFDQKDYVRAERDFERASQVAQKLPGDNRNWIVQAQQAQAKALIKENRLQQAENILNQSIEIFGKAGTIPPAVMLRLVGPLIVPVPYPPPTLLGTYGLLELTYAKQAKWDKAYDTFKRNMDMIRALPRVNPKAIQLATEIFTTLLSPLQDKQSDYLNKAYREGMTLLQDRFPDDIQMAGRMEASYADRLRLINENDKAEQLYLQAMDHLKGLDHGDDTALPRVINSMANLYAKTDRNDEAEKLFKQEQELLLKWQPKSSDSQIQLDSCRADYATFLRSQHRDEEANKMDVRHTATPAQNKIEGLPFPGVNR